jgi:hypothetical protein
VTTLLAVPTLVLGLYWSPLSATVRNGLQIHRGEIMQAMIDAPKKNLAAVKLDPNTTK